MISRGPPLPSTPIGRSTPLHVVLAQLSFSTDIPREDFQRNPGSVWSGLLCTSFEDDDLFFDAEQDRTNNGSFTASILQARGGSNDTGNEPESQTGKATTTETCRNQMQWGIVSCGTGCCCRTKPRRCNVAIRTFGLTALAVQVESRRYNYRSFNAFS